MAMVQTMHLHPEPDPPVYDGFRQMESISNALRVDALSNFTAEISAMALPGARCVSPDKPLAFPSQSNSAGWYSKI